MTKIFKSKLNFKGIIGIVLSLCVLLSVFVPMTRGMLANAIDADEKMLYIKSTVPEALLQSIRVEEGKTYNFTFGLSDTIANFNAVCYTDGNRDPFDADITLVSSDDLGGSTVYTYSYTIPAGFTDEYIFFGIEAVGNIDGYLFGATVYDAADTNKTQLLKNSDFGEALDWWSWGWEAWFAEWDDSGLTEWSDSKTTLKVVDYDEATLGINGSGSGSGSQTEGKMLYIKSTGPKELIHRANVEAGKTYYLTFGLSNSIRSFSAVCYTDGARSKYDANITQVNKEVKGNCSIYTYSYTVSNDFTGSLLFFGIKASGSVEGYLFGLSLYDSADTNKTELIANADFAIGLDNWAWGWDAWFGTTTSSGTDKGLTEWSNSATTLKIVNYDENILGLNSSGSGSGSQTEGKMLYVKSSGPKELIQRADVQAGKTYYLTFGMSNSIRNFSAVCYTDGARSKYDANITQVSKEVKGNCSIYTYSYTVANDFTDSMLFFGVKASGNIEGYIFGVSIYDSADTNKTELFSNPDFSLGLDDWSWGWDAWFGTTTSMGTDKGLTEWSNSATTLKILNYDENVLGLSSSGTGTQIGKKMLYINSAGPRELIQRANVQAGKTYYFTFGMSNSIRNFSAVCYTDGARSNYDANISQVSKENKGGYSIYTYSYTIPQSFSESLLFFGVKATGVTEGYLFDISIYDSADANKTELFTNADFSIGLDDWSWGWEVWFATSTSMGTEAGLTEWTGSGSTTLKIMDYNESLFGGGSVAGGRKMLYFRSSASKVMYQRIKVNVGESYIYNFSLSGIEDYNIVATIDGSRNSVDVAPELLSKENKAGYSVYSYKITVPATSENGTDMTDTIFLGVQPTGVAEGYMFDFSVYKNNDTSKTELYTNADFSIGLDDWAYGWEVWFATSTSMGTEAGLTEWSNSNTLIKILDYDEELFLADANAAKKMLYFVNGANTRQFGYRVKLEPSETYCLEFGMFSTSETSLQVCENGLRATVNVENTIETKANGNYTEYKITFTMPEQLNADSYFVGPQIYYYSEGYIFDMLLYKKSDTTKKNLYQNSKLKTLDGWIWGWSAWFGSSTDSGLTEWSDGIINLDLMDFDASKIDALIALLTSDDGEWWKPEDLISDEKVETSTIKGTLVDQNNNSLKNVKLQLISDENTYTTATNSKGEFIFKDFVSGFYELHTVGADGKLYNTGYFNSFDSGDVVTLNLVCDSSGIYIEDDSSVGNDTQVEDTENSDTEEKASVGVINGTVYTPELKTVADIKVYMRGVGETVTDKNGSFSFADVPVGEYELYTVLDDGKEYIFRKVSVKEKVELSVKLKYDVSKKAVAEEETQVNWLLIIIAGIAVIVIAGLAVLVIIKKKLQKNNMN